MDILISHVENDKMEKEYEGIPEDIDRYRYSKSQKKHMRFRRNRRRLFHRRVENTLKAVMFDLK